MRRMRLPETQLRPVERAKASSKSCPTASRKATCECTKRCDRSSMKVAMRSDLHGASVAQVPATATMQRQSPTSAAQSRRPVVAAITGHRGRPSSAHAGCQWAPFRVHDTIRCDTYAPYMVRRGVNRAATIDHWRIVAVRRSVGARSYGRTPGYFLAKYRVLR